MSDDTQVVAVVESIEAPVADTQQAVTIATVTTEPEAAKPKEETVDELAEARRLANRAVKRQFKAEAEAEYLREQIARDQARQQAQPKAQPVAEAEPKLEDFQDYETYLKAAAKFEARQEIQKEMQQHSQKLEQEKAQAAQRQSAESWNQKVAKATADMPDFADVVGSSTVPMPEHVKAVVLHSEQGPKLAYYLASHPDEAEQIANQHPLASIRALMRIEDTLAAQPASKQTTDAPPPIKPAGSTAKSTKAPPDMTPKEFAEWRKTYIKNRH